MATELKVLHVIAGMDPTLGGVCQAVRTMIVGLAREGAHNEVLTIDAPTAPFLSTEPFPVHALGPSQGPWAYSAQLIPWLQEHLTRFEVIIVHGLWLYHGYAVKKALTRLQRTHPNERSLPRLFVMPHGMLDPYFQRATGRRLKALRNYVYWQLLESHLINEACGILFTCAEECQLAHQAFPRYRPRQECVVGLGVAEPPPYTPAMQTAFAQHCPAVVDTPYLLFLSRIHEKKGVELLIKAYAALWLSHSARPDAPLLPKLVIAGPGLETTYGQQMQQLVAATPQLNHQIVFTGMLDGNRKWGAFYGCEAFVLPSHQENFGIAVVEALACSKPVLISNQVNIWQEIVAAGGGQVAADTLPGTLKLLQIWSAASSEEKTLTSQRARTAFTQTFAIDSAARRLIKTLREN